jgi:aspartate/methionine/tyrosine aminotransferase
MFAKRTNWPLAPNRLSQMLEEFRAQGRAVLDLAESNPTPCGFACDAGGILTSLADPRALRYEPDPRGLLPAREAVARYYAELGVNISPQQIFLTTSTSEAYSYVFRLLADPGDAVLVPRPSYPLFEFLSGLNDLQLVPYVLHYHDGWGIDLGALGATVRAAEGRARAILTVHPNNPTGSFVWQRELDTLTALCRDHGLALIADEVFRDYGFAAHPDRVPTHAGEARALTFTLSGLSKISALPQMKLAWIVASGPPDLLDPALDRLEVIADTYLSVSAPLAHALPALLDMRRAMQPQIIERVRENLRFLDDLLTPQMPVSRLKCEGGWYAILRVPATRSDEDWAAELLAREHVFVHPGHFYDFEFDGHLVISLLPLPDVFQQAVAKLIALVSRGAMDFRRS